MLWTKQELKAILANALGEISKELWSKEEAGAFVERFAQEIAEQHVLAATAATPEKACEYKANITVLLASLQSEATTRYIVVHGFGKNVFVGALRAVISLLVHAVLVS